MRDRKRYANLIIFVIFLIPVVWVMYSLFYHQAYYMWNGLEDYASDMKAYILKMQGLDSGYEFPYPIFFWVGNCFDLFAAPDMAIALATLTLNVTGIVVTKLAIDTYIAEKSELTWAKGVLSSFCAISLHFISMLFPPEGIYLPGIRFRYVGVFSANPFHNATYMAARPFAVLAFLWFVRLLEKYEKEDIKRDGILFSMFLLLATMTKPSFTIVLVGAAGLIMVYRMVRSRLRNWKQTFALGYCFIPTFLDLLYQYKGVFVPKEGAEGGIGFCFGDIWALYCDNIWLGIGLAIGFPILCLLFNWKELRVNALYRFGWQIYAMGFTMAFLLYEKGFRKPDFNFSWGYMYGIFFVFFVSVTVLIRTTVCKERKWYALVPQWGAFLWHLVCGVYYFVGIYNGGTYY